MFLSVQTGCLGCASGKGAGPRNVFGNKYGQDLAAVQIARERRLEAKEQQEKEAERRREPQRNVAAAGDEDDGEEETDDDDDDDDYGPSPAAGIWAGSQKLLDETAKLQDEASGETKEGSKDDDNQQPPAKKKRHE